MPSALFSLLHLPTCHARLVSQPIRNFGVVEYSYVLHLAVPVTLGDAVAAALLFLRTKRPTVAGDRVTRGPCGVRRCQIITHVIAAPLLQTSDHVVFVDGLRTDRLSSWERLRQTLNADR